LPLPVPTSRTVVSVATRAASRSGSATCPVSSAYPASYVSDRPLHPDRSKASNAAP
jgi:hypothetical protein